MKYQRYCPRQALERKEMAKISPQVSNDIAPGRNEISNI